MMLSDNYCLRVNDSGIVVADIRAAGHTVLFNVIIYHNLSFTACSPTMTHSNHASLPFWAVVGVFLALGWDGTSINLH
jgi:hypothetical protein